VIPVVLSSTFIGKGVVLGSIVIGAKFDFGEAFDTSLTSDVEYDSGMLFSFTEF